MVGPSRVGMVAVDQLVELPVRKDSRLGPSAAAAPACDSACAVALRPRENWRCGRRRPAVRVVSPCLRRAPASHRQHVGRSAAVEFCRRWRPVCSAIWREVARLGALDQERRHVFRQARHVGRIVSGAGLERKAGRQPAGTGYPQPSPPPCRSAASLPRWEAACRQEWEAWPGGFVRSNGCAHNTAAPRTQNKARIFDSPWRWVG